MKKKSARAFSRIIGVVALLAVFFAAGYFSARFIAHRHAPPTEPVLAARQQPQGNAGSETASPSRKMSPPVPELPGRQLAIIIDDIGIRREPVERLLAAGIPLTFSVMPDQPHTKDLAARIAATGQEVMLHLPMEPENERMNDPGTGALLVTQPDQDIRAIIAHDVEQMPQAKGVNNHMGSLFTQNERKMEVVLAELKRRGLFFIDSLTSPASVGFAVARRMGLKTAARRIFLDDDNNGDAIARNLRLAIELAAKEGSVVAIGHPHPATVAAIEKLKDDLVKAGVKPVFASQVVR